MAKATASEVLKSLVRGEHDLGVNFNNESIVHNVDDSQAAMNLYDKDHRKYRVTVVRVPNLNDALGRVE